jgi:hypothetical protein
VGSVVLVSCVRIDRRDRAVIVVMGGVHVFTLSVDGSGDIGAAP